MDTFRAAVKAKLAGSSSGNTGGSAGSGTLYRVRKSWSDASSQLGAFAVLDNAKELADKNPGYAVFDEAGKKVYPSASGSTGSGTLYRVRKSWADAASQKGAFNVLDNAKRCADENPGYSVLTRPERLYMRAAQPLLLTRCRRATACGPLQKSASETAPGTMRSRN